MGRSRTAVWQVGRVYMIKGIPHDVIRSQGTPGNEYVWLKNIITGEVKRRKQQYRMNR